MRKIRAFRRLNVALREWDLIATYCFWMKQNYNLNVETLLLRFLLDHKFYFECYNEMIS